MQRQPWLAALPLALPRDCLVPRATTRDCLLLEQPQGDCLLPEQSRVALQAPARQPREFTAMMFSRPKRDFDEPQGHSSAVASVLYSRGGSNTEVTKSGSYIYHGDASQYHEWEFRTRLRVKAAGNEEGRYAEAMSKVVDGLRGDAFIVAKEVGLESLWSPGALAQDVNAWDEMDGSEESETTHQVSANGPRRNAGVGILIEAIRASVFPLTTYEAK